MPDTPVMYTEMSEVEFIRWSLDYQFPQLVDAIQSIDQEWLFRTPVEGMNPPGHIFCHVWDNEAFLVQALVRGRSHQGKLKGLSRPNENALRAALGSVEEMAAYAKEVRGGTMEALDELTDDMLKREPKDSAVSEDDPNRHNPIREAFVMAIQHQSYHLGQLRLVERVLAHRKAG